MRLRTIMDLLQRLKCLVKDAVSPYVFAADADQLPPVILHARCCTWMDWVVERLESERYGGVACHPASTADDPLHALQDDRHMVLFCDDNGEALIKKLTELGRISNLHTNSKRHIIVRHLHRIPVHLQPRLKSAVDRCHTNCCLTFTCKSLSQVHCSFHSRCALVNCNPLRESTGNILRMLGEGAGCAAAVVEDAVQCVVNDPRSDDLIACVMLLEHKLTYGDLPADLLGTYVDELVTKLTSKTTTIAQTLTAVRQASRFACQYKLNVGDFVRAITRRRGQLQNSMMAGILKAATDLPIDGTQRHTLVACETFLWHVYALGQGLDPVL